MALENGIGTGVPEHLARLMRKRILAQEQSGAEGVAEEGQQIGAVINKLVFVAGITRGVTAEATGDVLNLVKNLVGRGDRHQPDGSMEIVDALGPGMEEALAVFEETQTRPR